MSSVYDEFRPRDEREMCGLFEDLLFGRFGEIMGGDLDAEDKKTGKKLTMSDGDLRELSRLGIINRIFRRWFQTTWGYEPVSPAFDGETPRQELSRVRPGLADGADYLSVNLEREADGWHVKPYYYPRQALNEQGGLIPFGLRQLQGGKQPSEPFFDQDFAGFIQWLDFGKTGFSRRRAEDPSGADAFGRYWKLFMRIGPADVAANWEIRELSQGKFSDFRDELAQCITEFFAQQRLPHGDYLNYDDLFAAIWGIAMRFDRDLMDLDELARLTETESGLDRSMKDKRVRKSAGCMHDLGVLLDRHIFFPMERYFNGLEMVWTDKMSFLHDLTFTVMAVKEGRKSGGRRREQQETLWAISPYDLRYAWFAPCTAMRLTGPLYRYFHD